MGKVKSIFTMATLHLIKVLLDFSSRVLPVFIIAITLLKLTKVFELDWRLIIAVLVLEVILIIVTIVFYSLFFIKFGTVNEENANSSVIEQPKKLPILNIVVVFFAFLGIIFIILKLFKAVTWSWVWVLSPLWLSTALTISILIICVIVSIVSAVSKKNKENNTNSDTNEDNTNNSENINNIESSNPNNSESAAVTKENKDDNDKQ